MAIATAKWINLTDTRIRYIRGVSGVPWPGCDADPGGVIEAPDSIGYARMCAEAGYTPFTADMQRAREEDAQLKAMIAEEEAQRSAQKSEQKAALPIVEESPKITETEQPAKGIEARGRSYRSPKG